MQMGAEAILIYFGGRRVWLILKTVLWIKSQKNTLMPNIIQLIINWLSLGASANDPSRP